MVTDGHTPCAAEPTRSLAVMFIVTMATAIETVAALQTTASAAALLARRTVVMLSGEATGRCRIQTGAPDTRDRRLGVSQFY